MTFFGVRPSSSRATTSSLKRCALDRRVSTHRERLRARRVSFRSPEPECDRVFSEQVAFGFRPAGFRHQPVMTRVGPAFLRQMRHHRREHLDQDIGRFTIGGPQVGRDLFGLRDCRDASTRARSSSRDFGDAVIEPQPFDVLLNAMQMRHERSCGISSAGCSSLSLRLAAPAHFPTSSPTSRQIRCTKRAGALHALFGPDHVALGRRIRQHEPARSVGAVGRR